MLIDINKQKLELYLFFSLLRKNPHTILPCSFSSPRCSFFSIFTKYKITSGIYIIGKKEGNGEKGKTKSNSNPIALVSFYTVICDIYGFECLFACFFFVKIPLKFFDMIEISLVFHRGSINDHHRNDVIC